MSLHSPVETFRIALVSLHSWLSVPSLPGSWSAQSRKGFQKAAKLNCVHMLCSGRGRARADATRTPSGQNGICKNVLGCCRARAEPAARRHACGWDHASISIYSALLFMRHYKPRRICDNQTKVNYNHHLRCKMAMCMCCLVLSRFSPWLPAGERGLSCYNMNVVDVKAERERRNGGKKPLHSDCSVFRPVDLLWIWCDVRRSIENVVAGRADDDHKKFDTNQDHFQISKAK